MTLTAPDHLRGNLAAHGKALTADDMERVLDAAFLAVLIRASAANGQRPGFDTQRDKMRALARAEARA